MGSPVFSFSSQIANGPKSNECVLLRWLNILMEIQSQVWGINSVYPNQTKLEQMKPTQSGPNETNPKWTKSNQSEVDQIKLDQTGPNETNPKVGGQFSCLYLCLSPPPDKRGVTLGLEDYRDRLYCSLKTNPQNYFKSKADPVFQNRKHLANR